MPPLRLLSLDAFRGLTIAAMVLVNNPGTWAAVYAPLKHAEWHGLTPTDVIFPFFLFIVGMAIPLSRPTAGRVLRRAAVIVVLGAAWGVWFPLNKSLWTSSYAVLTAGGGRVVVAWGFPVRPYPVGGVRGGPFV